MENKTYEVISKSKVVNLNNETVKELNEGDTVTGELVLIDENPYIEVADGFVSTSGLAEKLVGAELDLALDSIETKVKASNKKLILALVGAGVGFGVAHFMKVDKMKKILFVVGGITLGLGVEYLMERKK